MAPQAREMLDGPRSTFQVGEVLGKTFSIWLANLIPFAIIALIIFSPLFLWTFMVIRSDLTADSIKTWQYGLPVATSVLNSVLTGAVTFGVIQQLRGQKADIGTCISVGFSRLLPVLGVALLAGLAVGLGLLLLIVPGIILAIMFIVAVPVAIIEKPGVTASLGRSRQLTNGSKWPIFVVVFILGLLGGGLNYVLQKTMGAGGTVAGIRNYMFVVIGTSALIQGPLSAVASAVIYHDLRRSHEGASVEDIAKVFD